ncbi:MAG: DUF2993 domain-containing protein [Leptolyngbyaceae bacterium]|nr:DUF2993 domain-containing protein [Leptolyngbyaceae bacterium]
MANRFEESVSPTFRSDSDSSPDSESPDSEVPESESFEGGSRLISRLLTPAIRLWLNTQIERAEQLDIAITASDRQILKGSLPQACITAKDVVYKGLSLSSIAVVAQNIRTNGLSVMRGKAFRLLAPVPIDIDLMLTEAHLRESLAAPLLADAVDELLQRIVMDCLGHSVEDGADKNTQFRSPPQPMRSEPMQSLSHPDILLTPGRLMLRSHLSVGDRPSRVQLDTGLKLHTPNTLMFENPQLSVEGDSIKGRSLEKLNQFSIPLGDTTVMERLEIQHSSLFCCGQILVMP